MAVTYVPTFQHIDWIDNQDRVQAGGANGFNLRFHALETEFQKLSDAVTQLSNAIDALGVTPATTVKVNVTPALVPIGTAGWQFTSGGFALKPAGVTGAHGMTSVVLPDNAVIQSLRGTGRNADSAQANPGAGSLRISLFRQTIAPGTTASLLVARVDGVGVNFDISVPVAAGPNATVDNDNFRYFINADLDNAATADFVQLNAFQVTLLST